MKKIGIFLDEIKDQNIEDTQKFSKLAFNTGNMAFWHSLKNQLHLDVKSRWYIDHIDQLDLTEYKAFITTDLIWIRQMQDFSYLNKTLDVIGDLPLIPISIGLQCDSYDDGFQLHPETVKVMKKIEQRCIMGVRGEYTARILRKYGITHFKVIGCPSLYMDAPGLLAVQNNGQPNRVTMNFETFYNRADKNRINLLEYGADHQFSFIEQTETEISEKNIEDKEKLHKINAWLSQKKKIFFDIADWRKELQQYDFSIGARFHGNVLALWEGVPALFITCDSRTKELCEYFSLPHIDIQDFDASKSIEDYYKLADYSDFHKNYEKRMAEWREFLKMNNLTNCERVPNVIRENRIILNEIKIGKNSIEYDYSVIGSWKDCFRLDKKFFIEYSEDFKKKIPYSIAVIPFLGNFLPISWVFNAEIIIEEIDKEYLLSIDEIKRGYQLMYPNIAFKGKLSFREVREKDIDSGVGKSALYFSGGVDAFSSLVNIYKENPILITIWGTDVYLKDIDGWEKISNNTKKVAMDFGLPYLFIKTSFRDVIHYQFLNDNIAKPIHENWWHGFQHGIALITHSAPIAFDKNIRRVYIASSYSIKSTVPYTCSSDPTMDNYNKNNGTRTIHEGFENTRQDKIRKVCRFFKDRNQKISLHVCWMTRDGNNCCQCEKCARTIFGIMAEGFDPAEFGFHLSKEKYHTLSEMIKTKKISMHPIYWGDVVNGLLSKIDNPLVRNNEAVRTIINMMLGKVAKPDYFYSTEFNKLEGNIHDDRPEIIMFRSDYNGIEAQTFEAVGGNTGNMVFTKALQDILKLTITSYNNAVYSEYSPSHIITSDLIWITPNSDYNYLITQMNHFNKAIFVPISVGLQAPKIGDEFKLNESTLRVLSMIQERAVIGCRGYYTADILNKNGIKNIEVIGCPSVYIKGQKGYNIQSCQKTEGSIKVISNFRTFYGKLSVKEKHFLSYCATRNYDFVEQTKHHFDLSHVSNDEKYFNYVNRWLTNRSNTFFDVDQWNRFVSVHDFSIGERFHGNVLALWNDIPALFIPIDSRTSELIEFFKLPYISIEEFDWNKSIKYYIEKADYSEFEKLYHNHYKNYKLFLSKNGIDISE